MFLADTNIFLEVLLAGNKAESCKAFLARNPGKIHISDFSLHSIGVILFRQRHEMLFKVFFEDVSFNTQIISLSTDSYLKLPEIKKRFNLDSDDAYPNPFSGKVRHFRAVPSNTAATKSSYLKGVLIFCSNRSKLHNVIPVPYIFFGGFKLENRYDQMYPTIRM